MHNFFRAVRLAVRNRLTLAAALCCSLMVALLWGANIGIIYPVVQVVFNNNSMHQWIDQQIDASERESEQRLDEIAQLKQELAAAPDAERAGLEREIRVQEKLLHTWQNTLAWARRWRPHVYRYLPDSPFRTLVLVVVLLMGGTLLKDVFLMGNMILVERLAQLATFDLRKEFYRRTLRMHLGEFGGDRTAGLVTRFTSDMNSLAVGINILLGKLIREPLKMAACLIGAGIICWRLLMLSLVITPLAIYLINRLGQSIKRANRRAMEELTQLYALLSETFGGIQAVKGFTMERYERNRLHQTAKQYYRRTMRITTYNALARPMTELMGMGIIGMAILAGGYLVLNEETHLLGIRMSYRPLDFGSLITFYALLIGVSDPARKMADIYNAFQESAAAADRIYEMADREPAIVELDSPKPVPAPHRELILDGVMFHYSPGQPVLEEVSLKIPFGETLAIVGPNGCGKSTLANLVPRFYDPTGGAVRLDDVDLREMRIRDLRGQIGLVTQQTLLFDDTIMNNIRYGSPAASDQEVIEAAKQAKAHRFIEERLEHGYDTMVGERGGKLSGGQRQRIALARAILRDPAIMILDEATSQVDPESERLIHSALQRFVRGRTTIMITHRMSTLELADRIVVMELGKIVDLGTHLELRERCGLYQRLHQQGLRNTA